jgi:hypothetical protein
MTGSAMVRARSGTIDRRCGPARRSSPEKFGTLREAGTTEPDKNDGADEHSKGHDAHPGEQGKASPNQEWESVSGDTLHGDSAGRRSALYHFHASQPSLRIQSDQFNFDYLGCSVIFTAGAAPKAGDAHHGFCAGQPVMCF